MPHLCVGLNFRHTLYPLYKSNRSPTPDTVVQGLQYLKASLKAMSVKVIEVRTALRQYEIKFICFVNYTIVVNEHNALLWLN